jgi:hypothetical protein
MQCLSIAQATTQLNGKAPEEHFRVLEASLPILVGPFHIDPDSGGKAALARNLANLLEKNTEIMVYVGDWSVWPSSINYDLFDGYRKSHGEVRPIWDAPAHLFSPGETATLTSIIAIGLFFVWDVYVFNSKGKFLLVFSHDEWMEFRFAVQADADELNAAMEYFGVKPLKIG